MISVNVPLVILILLCIGTASSVLGCIFQIIDFIHNERDDEHHEQRKKERAQAKERR